ncbi:MAG: DUF3570 domain-containing protein [Verrucomicrobia bacterium]|nr:DUF3570 domain-containing protein [Verrucomicrobiota bacterium]
MKLPSPASSSARAALLATVLTALSPRSGRAEDAVRYKFQDYQELGGRVAVKVHGASVEKDFGTDNHLKVEGVIDAIAGATPNGQPAPAGSDQVPLASLTERRKAWNATFAHQFPRVNVAIGAGNSRESDYVSTGWSLNTLTDFNQKNTTLLAGLAGTDDDVRVFHQTPWEKKRGHDVIVGVTQLLDPRTSVTFNLTWGRQRGYLADPYKLVQKDTEIFPGISLPLTFAENRPAEREKWIGFAALNRSFPELRGAIDLSYRLYHDTYDSTAHTIDAAWFQQFGERLIFRPGLRFHDQGAASFYHYRLDGTAIVPVNGPPRPQGPFYSSDYRLSALQTFTYGAKLIWNVTDALQVDAAFERYDMRGTDRVTPQSAYCRARILTVGLKFAW